MPNPTLVWTKEPPQMEAKYRLRVREWVSARRFSYRDVDVVIHEDGVARERLPSGKHYDDLPNPDAANEPHWLGPLPPKPSEQED